MRPKTQKEKDSLNRYIKYISRITHHGVSAKTQEQENQFKQLFNSIGKEAYHAMELGKADPNNKDGYMTHFKKI